MTLNLSIPVLTTLAFIVAALLAWGGFALAVRRRKLSIRAYPLFSKAAGEIGRAAEEGALVHLTLGSGSLIGDDAMTSVAALEGMTPLLSLAAAYDTPPIITSGDPTLYLLADDWMRRAYLRVGNVDRYRPLLVQFSAADSLAYAAWASTYALDAEKGGTQVMVGAFEQEVSLLTDAAVRKGFYLMGGAVSPIGIASLYPTTSVQTLAMGEDLFTGAAAGQEKPSLDALVWAEEAMRWLLILAIVAMVLLSVAGIEVGG